MNRELFIKQGEELVQIDGKVYKIPKNVDLIEQYKDDTNVMRKVIELAKLSGTEFNGFDEGIVCSDCKYTGLYRIAEQQGIAVSIGGDDSCGYEGNTDLISVFLKDGTPFMAKDRSCTVKDVFYRTLVKQGYLDKFLLVGVKPEEFHSIKSFKRGGDLETTTIQEYRKMMAMI